ncbi:MAG: DNA polymerase III subunit beta [Verrucomicrobiota bacterium]
MQSIILPVAELKPALVGLGKVLNRHSGLPVLGSVKVERTSEGWIALTVTDLDHYATVRLEQPSQGDPLCVLVPFEELLRTTKTCGKGEELHIEPNGKDAVVIKYAIGQQMAERNVESFPVEEFPPTPRIKADPVVVDGRLRSAIHEALECASSDETRLILNGAYIDVSDTRCHNVVGTDGRHLYSSNSFNLPLSKSLLIPGHKFLGWKEFSNDGEWQLKVGPEENPNDPPPFQISSRRWRFITKQIAGNYPNWRQVVPGGGSMASSFEFDPEAVAAVIQAVQRMPCHDAVNLTIGLEISGAKLWLLGRSPTAEKWTRVEIAALKCSGKDMTIFLNRNLLAKALGFGLRTVEIIDALSPLRFSSEGRQMIVMPVRSEAPSPQSTDEAEESQDEPETINTEQPAAPLAAAPIETTPMVNDTTGTRDST